MSDLMAVGSQDFGGLSSFHAVRLHADYLLSGCFSFRRLDT